MGGRRKREVHAQATGSRADRGRRAIQRCALDDPLVQTVGVPFVVALVVAAVIRGVGGAGRGGRLMGLGVPAGFLAGYVLFEGVPFFPPVAAKQKVFFLVLLGAAAGLTIDAVGRRRALRSAAAVIFPAVCVVWLAWRQVAAGPTWEFAITAALLWLGLCLILWRLNATGERAGAQSAVIVLLATSAGAAVVAMFGRSLSLVLLFVALAAAAGALVLWAYAASLINRSPIAFGATALLGGGGALVALACVLALYTPAASLLALAILLLVPFADTLATRLPLGGSLMGRVLGPPVLAAICAVPALAAVGVATLSSG